MSASGEAVFWLKRASLAVQRAVDETLARHGLTGPQFVVLSLLWERDGQAQRDLAEHIGITGATLSTITDGLVERGLVARQLDPDDARVKRLFLTERGRALREETAEVERAFHARFARGFSPGEISLLTEWLRRAAANMQTEGTRHE